MAYCHTFSFSASAITAAYQRLVDPSLILDV